MALTACRECGQEVSRSAPTCPHCGIKRPGKQWYDVDIKMGGCGGCLAVLVVVWLIIVGIGQIDTSSLVDSPSTPRASSGRQLRWAHNTVNVRSGRGTNFDALTTLRSGESVQVDSLVGGWFRVFRAGRKIGYTSASVLHDGPIPASQFEVTDISIRVTEKNRIWWRYAWQLKIRNTGSRSLSLDATIEFQDKDGFVVDTDNEYNLFVAVGEEKTFTGFQLVSMPGAADVDKVYAKVTR